MIPQQSNDSYPTVANLNDLVTNGSCFKLTWASDEDYSFFKYTGTLSASFVTTDGKLSQVRKASGLPSQFAMAEGSNFTFDGRELVNLYGQQGTVMKEGSSVSITGTTGYFRVYCPSAGSVKVNGNDVAFVQVGDYVEPASVTINREWSGNISTNYSITISSSATLTLQAGATLTFGQSKSLLSYGAVWALGSSNAPVTFTSLSPSGTWSGIAFIGSSASGSILQHTTVEHVLTYGGAAVNNLGANSVTLSHCNISNNTNYGTTGLYVRDASYNRVGNSTISGNGGHGITFNNAYAEIFKNTIQNNSYAGVFCYHSSPYFGTYPFYSPDGNNVITGNSYGVIAGAGSYPWIGSVGNTWVGYNSICDNTTAIDAYYYSIVGADANWFGPSPTQSMFPTDGTSKIYWENYLTYDPNGNVCGGNAPIAGFKGGTTATLSMADTNDVIFRALKERFNRNRGRARGLLQSALVSNLNSEQGLKAAMILTQMNQDSSDSEIFNTMMRLWQQRRSNHPLFAHSIAKMLQKESRIPEAATVLNGIASSNRNNEYERMALLTLFYMYFTSPQYASRSSEVLQELQRKFPTDAEVKQAMWVYGIAAPSRSNNLGRSISEQKQEVKPSSFVMHKNFPNPFNPSTTIRFDLPEPADVSLVVYDVLGRKVAELANGYREAGYHPGLPAASISHALPRRMRAAM